jgi:predicted nucleic acid-binding protein
MIYLDANIFIYAFVSTGKEGENARKLIKKIRTGKERTVTSALSFDEIFWGVKKEKGFEKALITIKAVLEMPNLVFIKVDDTILWQAYNLIKKYKLDPRDSIHAACAITHGVFTIFSEDPDFDKIKEINRKGLE